MHLSKRTQYGLRAAVRLARQFHAASDDASPYVQSRDLAEVERLPTKFLEQVLLILRRAELLESKVGSGGGYRLGRPPEQISVGQLLDALEPPAELDRVDPPTLGCRAVELVTAAIDGCRAGECNGWTLADLAADAARRAEKADAMYYI